MFGAGIREREAHAHAHAHVTPAGPHIRSHTRHNPAGPHIRSHTRHNPADPRRAFLARLLPAVAAADCAILCKQYLIWNVLSLLFFYQAAFSMEDTGPGANALLPFNLWLPQGAIGLSFAVLNALVVKDLPKGTGML